MTYLFIDTGYLIALEVMDDQHHESAIQHWQGLLKSSPALVTTYVFDEVVTFFNSRNYHSKAVEIGINLINSPSIQLIHVDESLFHEGWQYLKTHADKSYSLTDCISFIMALRVRVWVNLYLLEHGCEDFQTEILFIS